MLSLGMCTSMTVRLYASRSNFPLEAVRVVVREHTPEGGHLPDGLSLELELRGEQLSAAQRDRLLRAAARCPVKRMLAGEMQQGVHTELV